MATTRYLVDDIDAAVRFYTEALGFTVLERWGPAFAIIERDGLRLWVSGPETSAARPMPDGRVPEPGGWNRIVLEVEDLAGMVADLKRRNVTFRNEVIQGPGGSQVLVEDPAGNPIELFESRES